MTGSPVVAHCMPARHETQRAYHLSCSRMRYVQLAGELFVSATHADMTLMPSQQRRDVCMTET